MTRGRILAISSSPSTNSRSEAVAAVALRRLEDHGHQVEQVVLRDLPAEDLLLGRAQAPGIAEALEAVRRADAVVIATPVYKAAYSGVLKVFLDLLDQNALRGKHVLPLASGGTPANVLALDYALRPVLESLGARHLSRGRVVLASQIGTGPNGRRQVTAEARQAVEAATDAFAETLEAHLAHRLARARRRSIVIVGGGPRALGLLDRFAANLPPGTTDLAIHVVDPQPVGAGRIWRADQSELLWMNSTAADVTVFTDETVKCEGPVTHGPSLAEWATGQGRAVLAGQGWPVSQYGPDSFLPRGVQAEYLGWAWRRTVDRLPSGVRLQVHRHRAVDLLDQDGLQVVVLESGAHIPADVVVLAQGHFDQALTASQQDLLAKAAERDLTYIPPAQTADLDLDALAPGEPVLVRGLGLAFIDLVTLLTQGRGGHFTGEGTDLTYVPSGREPRLLAASGRGVPYHAKLGYSIDTPTPLRYLTPDRLARLGGPGGQVDVERELWPLVADEITHAHYRRLFQAHADRTHGSFEELRTVLDKHGATSAEFSRHVAAQVPDEQDRINLLALQRPLAGQRFPSWGEASRAVVTHVADDLARRQDPAHSSDRAVFEVLVGIYVALGELIAQGRIGAEDRTRLVEGEFKSFFSFIASGPPPRRLAELLALQRAGLVTFLGPDVTVALEGNAFQATSTVVDDEPVRTRALVDAFLPAIDVVEAADPLLQALLRRDELLVEPAGALGARRGLLVTDAQFRAVRADGSVHPRRHLLGPAVSASAAVAAFHRPRTNGAAFRQNDRIARLLLREMGIPPVAGRPVTDGAEAPSRTDPTLLAPRRRAVPHPQGDVA